MTVCTYRYEGIARRQGYAAVAGVDEVGRGSLFGPVVAAAVLYPSGHRFHIRGLRDSKQLTAMQREMLDGLIRIHGRCGIGAADAKYIDEHGIRAATQLAMARAIAALAEETEYVLVDGDMRIEDLPLPQRTIVHGDSLSSSIASASIVAKVFRDGLVSSLAVNWPGYGLERHKGYPTPEHLKALREHGPTPMHRMTFRGVQDAEYTRITGEWEEAVARKLGCQDQGGQ
jgi:ribonuclease HII